MPWKIKEFAFQSKSRISLLSIRLASFLHLVWHGIFMNQPELVMKAPRSTEGSNERACKTITAHTFTWYAKQVLPEGLGLRWPT